MSTSIARPTVRAALFEEHKHLCGIARTHKATSGFSHIMFSGEAAYQKGWIRVAELGGVAVGLSCVRHKVRVPTTTLYYIVVDPAHRRGGLGQLLLDDLVATTPHRCIELSCMKDNEAALAFYDRNGFAREGEALKGKGWHLVKTW